jgi:hypothetical protein
MWGIQSKTNHHKLKCMRMVARTMRIDEYAIGVHAARSDAGRGADGNTRSVTKLDSKAR